MSAQYSTATSNDCCCILPCPVQATWVIEWGTAKGTWRKVTSACELCWFEYLLRLGNIEEVERTPRITEKEGLRATLCIVGSRGCTKASTGDTDID